jgi:hypothetical protein
VNLRRNSIFSLLLLLPGLGAAEDFRLTDGTVFRGARVLEARPDALVLLHDRGIAIADLEKLPRIVRVRFGYDRRKAAAYRARDAVKRKTEADEKRRLITAYEEHQQERARALSGAPEVAMEKAARGDDEMHLAFRMTHLDRNFAAAVTYIAADIAQKAEARRTEARTSQTFWGAPFWKNPIVAILCGLLGSGARSDRSNSEPRNWR